jgi:putative ABC transport system substrate-binding protein
MTKTSLSAILWFRSDNRKSAIENRKWVGIVAIVVTFATCGAVAQAEQPKKVPRIGFLCAMNGPSPHTEGFLQGLRELGYIEGKNINIEYRFTRGRVDPFPKLAAELVRLKLDVIIVASPQAIRPAMEATRKTPIVMAQSDDPVRSGFIDSLARPGANVTGLSSMAPELSAKQLELLKEAVPKISRVAVLRNAANPGSALQLRETEITARALGVKLQPVEIGIHGGAHEGLMDDMMDDMTPYAPIRDDKDFNQALAAIRRDRANALIVLQDLMFFNYQQQLVDFAAKHRLPAIYGWRNFAEAGGLMSYGPSDQDMFRRAATYVDKILKGRKPADLPVEQPTKFEFIINLKTAKQIGLTIPPNVLARADRVIR